MEKEHRKTALIVLAGILIWYVGIMVPLNVYGLFGSKEWFNSVFETPRVLAFMASVGALQALLLVSALRPKLDIKGATITVLAGTIVYYVFFGFFREGDWLNRIFNILVNTSFVLMGSIIVHSIYKRMITFPRLIGLLTAAVVLVLNTLLHIMLVNPILEEIKKNRHDGVAEVVKQQDINSQYCTRDHVYCFDFNDLGKKAKEIPLSEDDLIGITNFYESAPHNPGVNYQWEMSIPHTFYYRVIGAFFDNNSELKIVISNKRDYRNLNIAIEDTTYFLTTSAGSTWMFIMLLIWWFHWRKGLGRNGKIN